MTHSRQSAPTGADRRRFTRLAAFGLLGATLAPAWAQAPTAEKFPSSTVTLVVPFPAGGATDVVARRVSQQLAQLWKVPVVVENRVGAAGNVAADYVARAPANGHTILLGAVSMVTNPPLYKLPAAFVPRVLTPVGVGVMSHLVTIARADLPVRDIPGMLALAASRPGGLNGASAGAGTLSHLGLELLSSNHKARISHVPYKGSAPALNDLMGGHVDVMVDTIGSAGPLIASGKAKALGVHSARRQPPLPNVPTYEEQGIQGMTFGAWNIFVVPTATPPDRVATLHAALARVIQEPATSKALNDRGFDVLVQSPAESLAFMRQDGQRWERLIREKNLSL